MPSDRIYEILVDRDGLLWLASDQGVTRYDGYEFHTYTTQHGLVTNDIYGFWEDSQGRIWLYSHANQVNMIDHGKVFSFPTGDRVHLIRNFSEDMEGNVWCTISGQLYCLRHKGEWEKVDFKPLNKAPVYYRKRGNEELFFCRYGRLDEKERWVPFSKLSNLENTLPVWSLPNGNQALRDGDKTLLFFDPFEERVLRHPLTEYFPDRSDPLFRSLLPFIGDSYLLSSDVGTVVVNGRLELIENWNLLLSLNPISGSYDSEGNIWIVDDQGALHFIPPSSLALRHDTRMGPVCDVLELGDGKKLLATTNGKLYSGDGGEWRMMVLHWPNPEMGFHHFRKIIKDPKGQVYIAGDQGLFCVGNASEIDGKEIVVIPSRNVFWKELLQNPYFTGEGENLPLRLGIKDIDVDELGNAWLGTGFGLIHRDAQGIFSAYWEEGLLSRINVVALEGNRIWLGRNNGLGYIDRSSPIEFHPVLIGGGPVLSLAVTPSNDLLIGTDGKGLYKLGLGTQRFAKHPALESTIVRDIQLHGDRIFLSTNKGLKIIQAGPWNQEPPLSLLKEQGLLTNRLTRTRVVEDSLYIFSKRGLSKISLEDLPTKPRSPEISLRGVRILGRDSLLEEGFELPHDLNQIDFYFHGQSFISQGKARYRYRLLGLDTTWYWTQHREVTYSALVPGDYRFEVEAESITGGRSLASAHCEFAIRNPWWRTWWASLAAFLLGGAILSFIIWRMQIRSRKRLQHHRKMAALELKALQGQMNPHFIFNAMNAIQNFILDHDLKQANRYLIQFAELIRRYLDGADQRYVSLKEELETLGKYVELSQMRMPNLFDYEVKVADDIDLEESYIPGSLLQPLLENAILHGLRHRSESGLLQLLVKREGAGLILQVKDNGIGRKASLAKKGRLGRQRRSHGLVLVRQRIETLNQLAGIELRMEIHDLMDPDMEGRAIGTRIDIYQRGNLL